MINFAYPPFGIQFEYLPQKNKPLEASAMQVQWTYPYGHIHKVIKKDIVPTDY